MKRFFGALFLALYLSTSTTSTAHQPALQKYIASYDTTTITSILGYDPCITLYPGTGDTPVIYFHGFGDSQHSISFFKANSSMLPEPVIGFNFKDANFGSSLPLATIRNINLCQDNDIATAALVLKTLDTADLPAFHVFGQSRGGGTIITTIARLHKYAHHKKYKQFFAQLGITRTQAHRILEKIKAGSIVLNCPLVDVHAHIKEKLAPFGLGWATWLFRHTVLPAFSSYNPRGDSPLHAAKIVKKLKLNILVHFQKDDIVLGNGAEAAFYTTIMGPHTHVVVGNDNGHLHRGETLSEAIRNFRNGTLTGHQPTRKNVQYYIKNVYKKDYTFKPKHDVAWQQAFASYDMQPINNRLGYKPNIRVYQADTRVTDPRSTTVYVHGYGDNQAFTVPFFQLDTYLLPGTVVGFDFQDVIPGTFKINIKKSSVGQDADIATFASVLKILDDCGLETINIFGYSRGGATTVTTLARLCDYTKHAEFFTNLDINKQQAERIIHKIKAGTIVLNCPLVDSNSVARYWFKNFGTTFMNKIIPRIMEHRADGDQALHAAKTIQPIHFNILVHFQKNDTILGNSRVDAEFYNNLKGPNTYLVLADEGGHLHMGTTLGHAVQAFKKQYGTAYYPDAALLQKGQKYLTASPQEDNDVVKFVEDFYA